MKRSTWILALPLLLASVAAHAESHEMGHHPMAAQAAQAKHTGQGTVKVVNERAHKIQIVHEPIATLAWPAMTMWFGLETALPADLKAGDTVVFELEQVHGKKWSITHIAKP